MMVVFDEHDKQNVLAMLSSSPSPGHPCRKYACFPEEWTDEQISDFMESTKILTPGTRALTWHGPYKANDMDGLKAMVMRMEEEEKVGWLILSTSWKEAIHNYSPEMADALADSATGGPPLTLWGDQVFFALCPDSQAIAVSESGNFTVVWTVTEGSTSS